MGSRQYREYSEDFKIQALELLKRRDKSAGQIERELGRTPGKLVKWRTRYQNGVESGKIYSMWIFGIR